MMTKGNSYEAVVRKCEVEQDGSDVFLLELDLGENNDFQVGPGQFVVLEPKNNRAVMSRPFSVVDFEDNIVSLLIKVVGPNTRGYASSKPGDKNSEKKSRTAILKYSKM